MCIRDRYHIPLIPQFITQDGNTYVSNDYTVEWSFFEGAETYNLFQNEQLVYSGNSTSFYFEDQVDGNYKYELHAVLPSEASIRSDSINISVNFIPETPVFTTKPQTIKYGQTVNLSWTYNEDIIWFSVIVENEEGVKKEIYNGTDYFIITEDFDLGQNRIRVHAQLSAGKNSDFSDSLFIIVDENSEDLSMISPIFLFVIFASISILRNRKE